MLNSYGNKVKRLQNLEKQNEIKQYEVGVKNVLCYLLKDADFRLLQFYFLLFFIRFGYITTKRQ